jgi:hypothetical protein
MTTTAGTLEKNKRTVTVRIPAWIDSVDSIVLGTTLKPDRLRVILHQFFLAWLKNNIIKKSKKVHHLGDYFAVSSEILKEVGTRDYARYIDLLLTGQVIERRAGGEGGRCYMPGGHAQLYRWNSPTAQPQFRIEKIEDFTTVKSVLRTRDHHQKIDCSINGAKESLPVFETLRDFVLDTTILGTDEIKDVLNEINWFIVDDFGGRFHHRISNMPKEQRQYLRFKGHEDTPLKVLDLRNSQPFFTALVSSKTLIVGLLPEFRPIIVIAEKYSSKPDFLLYRDLCVTGRLYEFFLEARGIDPSNKLERNKIKELLFRAVIFSKKRVYGSDKLFQSLFKSCFPSAFSFFSEVKALDELVLPEIKHIIRPPKKKFKYAASNDSHKILPCIMQRAESRMMYKVIAPRLIADGIRFVTIHDSFMILPEDVERTQHIIRESFEGMGLPAPSLSVT